MKRHGFLAAGLLGSATAFCLLLNRHGGLGATEEDARSFREALAGTQQPETTAEEGGVRLNYFDASWEKVLRNLAENQELTLVMDKVPPGRFARRDKTQYDLASALRILNSELEPQGYRLLHQKSYLIVLNLDKARTEYARPRIAPAEFDARDGQTATQSLLRSASESRDSSDSEDDSSARPLINSAAGSNAGRRPANGRARQAVRSSKNNGNDQEDFSSEEGFSTPIRRASHGSNFFPDEPDTAVQEGGTVLQEIPVTNAKAADVARTIFVVFEKRAQTQPNDGINGLPTFAVYRRAEDGSADKESAPLFRIGIDQDGNQLLVEAPEARLGHLRKLVDDLDRPAEFGSDDSVKLVPNNGISAKTAMQLTEQIHQLVSLADENAPIPGRPAGQPPVQGNPPDPAASGDDPAINLRGEVNVQAMQDLGILILKGNEADVQKVAEIIARLERMSIGSLPNIHLLTLNNVDSEALATLLTSVYEQLTELRQRGGENRKTAAFLPVVQPNAILILSSEIEREFILDLADKLDQPLDPDFEFQVFPLKSAIASQVVTALTTFYEERTGLGTSVRVIADVRTNSVIVQGRASELLEVSRLIERIDRDESASVNRLQIFKLKQAVAEELATTINAALQAVINPPQQSTGAGGGGGFGGGAQGAPELRANKSVALEFLTSSGGVRELIKSGILADVRVSSDIRSNSLLVTAPEASMGLMEALIAELDRAPDAVSEIKVFTLKNADAEQTVTMLETLFDNTNQEDQLGIQIAGTEGSSSSLIPLRFSADIRTNTVLAVGSGESLSVVEAILLRLDSDDTRQRTTSVIALRNAPADVVAASLLDFLEQQAALQDSAEDLLSNIERIRQEVLIAADLNSNSLIVSASPQYYSQIEQIIAALDARPPEVVIQALLVEVTLDATDEFGIELGFQDPLLLARSTTSTIGGITTIAPGLNFNNVSAQLGNNSGVGTNPGTVATQGLSNFSLGRTNEDLGFGGFVFSAQSDSVSVLLRALAARRTVHILSRPQVRATHNQIAYVTVGQLVPVTNGVTLSAQGIAQPQIIQQQTGITLQVTPRVTPDGIIAMRVLADKSSLAPIGVPIFVNAATGDTVNSPIINQSKAETVVNVPNGQTIVIGGMITKSDGTLERKVPWLGDLPIVGKAFRYDGTTTSRTELLIFLTPRIVLSDLDSELIKQVETERLHFVESEAEELHGPLYSVPSTGGETEYLPPDGTILSPNTPVDELIMQPVIEDRP